MRFHDIVHNRKPDPGPLDAARQGLLAAMKFAEDRGALAGGYSETAVLHGNPYVAAVSSQRHFDRPLLA